LITGARDAQIRLRVIHWDRSKAGRRRHPSDEKCGTFAELEPWAREKEAAGFNIYIFAQPVATDWKYAADHDVTGVRCLYADGDEREQPAKWHVQPTFVLVHPVTKRWWAFWRVHGFEKDQLRDFILRIAAQYGSDEKVSNLSRVVRLAGFNRWKDGKNCGPYELRRMSDATTAPWEHEDLPVLPKPPERTKSLQEGEEAIDQPRLRGLLALIHPFDREHWLKVMFVIRDSAVLGENAQELNEADKLALFDDWSSGDLHAKAADPKLRECEVGNYAGYEDNEFHWNTPRSTTAEPATLGTLVHLASEHAAKQNVPFPAELGRPTRREREYQNKFGFKPVEKPTNDNVAMPAPDGWPAGLYNGPDYADRPAVRWIIRNVVAGASYTVASGRSQAGKSFCELDLALSIALKPTWRDNPIERNGVIVWIAGEGQERIWNDACAWCAENGISREALRDKFFVLDHGTRLNTERGWAKLCEVIAAIEARTGDVPLYIVFDTLRKNMSGSVSKEDDVAAVLVRVDELQQKGIAVTLVAHHGRSHEETKGQTDWEDDANQVRRYSGHVRNGSTMIEFHKIKGAPDGWSVNVRYVKHSLPGGDDTLVAVAGDAPPVAPEAQRPVSQRNQHTQRENAQFMVMLDKAVVEVLSREKRGGYWTHKELAEALAMREDMGDVSSETLKRHTLKRLREDKTKRTNKLYDAVLKRYVWREK
jgi:hypothetical protein